MPANASCSWPSRWWPGAWNAIALAAARSPPPPAKNLAALPVEHPLHDVDAGYRRLAPVYLADYATADDGTRIVHCAPAYGLEDFRSCRAQGTALADILNPVQGNG